MKHIVWEGDNQFEIEDFIGVDAIETDDNPDILLIPTSAGLIQCDLGDAVIVNGNGVSVQKKGAFNIQ